jgi:hypothetical protein
MSSLWKDVVEGAVDTQQSSIDTAAIEAMITDDPATMVSYVADCTESMVALEAAVAMAEGRCAVKYLTATEESAKDEAKATMEGVLADAWDSIKELAEKAWKAIKAFIQKAWNKMKGFANVVKAFFTKYSSVIKGKNVNPKVKWVDVNLSEGLKTATELVDQIMRIDPTDAEGAFFGSTPNSSGKGSIGSNSGNNDDIYNAFFPAGPEGHGVPYETEWNKVKPTAIKIADQGVSATYQGMFKLGDKSERDIINDIKRRSQEASKNMEDEGNRGRQAKKVRVAVRVIRQMATVGNQAASTLYKNSVAACRKVIREEATTKESYLPTGESSSLDAFMSEIL